MAAPYSTRFVHGAPAAPGSLVYVVPAGFRAVIRTVSFTTGGTGGATFWFSSAGAIIGIWASVPAYNTINWDGRQVAMAGDDITGHVEVGGAYCVISGYLLEENA